MLNFVGRCPVNYRRRRYPISELIRKGDKTRVRVSESVSSYIDFIEVDGLGSEQNSNLIPSVSLTLFGTRAIAVKSIKTNIKNSTCG